MVGRVARTNLVRSHESGKAFELLSHVKNSETWPPPLYPGFIYFKLVRRILRTERVRMIFILFFPVRSGGTVGQHMVHEQYVRLTFSALSAFHSLK